MDTSFGAVAIREVPDAKEIKVVVIQTADVETEEEMDQRLTTLSLHMEQKAGGVVAVDAQFTRGVTWSWKTWPPVTLLYEIAVPQRCDVEIKTGEGLITVGALTGRVVVSSDTGGIFTSEIDGSIKARSRTGAVAITACNGPIEVSTDIGNITVGRANGPTQLTSRGGYIEVQRANSEIVIRGNGSDAQVGFQAPMKHATDITTSGGSIFLRIDIDVACTLDLRSSIFGKVSLRGGLPLVVTSGGVGKSSLKGTVNAGGSRIQARASGGNVSIRGMEPLAPDGKVPELKLNRESDGGA
ncbi:MAG: hypothetical protein ABW223_08645 [Rariglobus sp.]